MQDWIGLCKITIGIRCKIRIVTRCKVRILCRIRIELHRTRVVLSLSLNVISDINCCIERIFTLHMQRERGKVIGVGVHTCICLWTREKIESYFRDRLTFSNICSRTSHRIYRLALPLRVPETLSSLSKSRISIFNAHLTLFVRRITSHNSIGKYCRLVN